jgi:hypothetical protein
MDIKQLNISLIENYFYTLLNGNVSDNVFASELPNTLEKNWDDMVVISVGEIDFDNAKGSGYVFIDVYTRPIGKGEKNVALMAELENKVCDSILSATHTHYKLNMLNRRQQGYDSTHDLHYTIFTINITII